MARRAAAILPLSYAPLTKPDRLPAVASPANINFSDIGSLSTSRAPKQPGVTAEYDPFVNGLFAQLEAKPFKKCFRMLPPDKDSSLDKAYSTISFSPSFDKSQANWPH